MKLRALAAGVVVAPEVRDFAVRLVLIWLVMLMAWFIVLCWQQIFLA